MIIHFLLKERVKPMNSFYTNIETVAMAAHQQVEHDKESRFLYTCPKGYYLVKQGERRAEVNSKYLGEYYWNSRLNQSVYTGKF